MLRVVSGESTETELHQLELAVRGGWPITPETRQLVIDRLTEAIRLPKRDVGPAPDTINEEESMIDGVGKQADRIITILKVGKLLERNF